MVLATTAWQQARADSCEGYVQGLVSWVNSNSSQDEERFVWFVMESNQAQPNQLTTYVRGRLAHDNCAGNCISGQGKVYIGHQPYSVSNAQHKIPGPFKPLSDESPNLDAPGPSMSVKLDSANPGTLFLSGTQVSQTQCSQDVMYGLEDVPAGQNPQTYTKSFFVISFNKMTAPKKKSPFKVLPKVGQ
jgi:hypothetical protein